MTMYSSLTERRELPESGGGGHGEGKVARPTGLAPQQ